MKHFYKHTLGEACHFGQADGLTIYVEHSTTT